MNLMYKQLRAACMQHPAGPSGICSSRVKTAALLSALGRVGSRAYAISTQTLCKRAPPCLRLLCSTLTTAHANRGGKRSLEQTRRLALGQLHPHPHQPCHCVSTCVRSPACSSQTIPCGGALCWSPDCASCLPQGSSVLHHRCPGHQTQQWRRWRGMRGWVGTLSLIHI